MRIEEVKKEVAFLEWISSEEGSEAYEAMSEGLQTELALSFLSSQLSDEEEEARGPTFFIRKQD